MAILSQTKTGTSAMVKSLGFKATIALNNPPSVKHIGYDNFEKFIQPLIEARTGAARSGYEVVMVMREPLDWLGSWYRYRTRENLANADNPAVAEKYTGNISFEDFIASVCQTGKRPAYARIGSPCSVAFDSAGKLAVDRIYPYEDLSGLYEVLEARLKRKVVIEKSNVSPKMPLELSNELQQMVRKTYPFECELHAALQRDGTIPERFKGASPVTAEGDDD